MTIHESQLANLRDFGYNEVESRFLYLVATHSGYFTVREKPYWPGRIQENWLVPAAEKAGLGRIGWHTFRHSDSTLLHALGVDLKVQQELLRQADIRTTMNIYTHAVPSALREANSKVVRLVLPAQVA
jgi:site-specific recombinase XerD